MSRFPEAPGDEAVLLGEAAEAVSRGRHQSRHWRESTITDDDLSDRGGVFFAAVEMTRMPMILTNPRMPDNPIVFANKAFLDLTGYEEAEVLGRNCRFLQGARTDREHVRQLREAVAAHQPISLEILNYKRDGTPFWNAVFVGPVTNPEGELLYFFASQLDVTRRRESEEGVRQAQKMEAVGQLTAGLAHDFNNLLQVIAGNHEQLMKRVEQPDLRRRLGNAQMATDRAAALTRQLLAFARKTRLDPKPVNLSAAVASFAELLSTTAGARVDLQLNLLQRLPLCLVDQTHLEAALLNIVANARDAMPSGRHGHGGHLAASSQRRRRRTRVALGRLRGAGGQRRGPGHDARGGGARGRAVLYHKGAGFGTGLGLAMVHGFLQHSRGRLEITSHVGRGTVVCMLLPVLSADLLEEDQGSDAGLPMNAANGTLDNKPAADSPIVLAVDDSEDVLALARDHLEDMGFRVLSASSAEEALAQLERADGGIDLLFTDLIMPGSMNGLQLAKEVQQWLPGLPVLLTTGYNEELAQGVKAPGMDVLGKPYRRTELADRVQSALKQAGQSGPRRRPSDFGAAEA